MNQIRAAELLKEAADALLKSDESSANRNNTVVPQVVNVASATRALFAPYRGAGSRAVSSIGGRRQLHRLPSTTYWTHKFVALASCSADVVPTRSHKQELYIAGLGEKKISFIKSHDVDAFISKIEDVYPKLKGCGGFELLRSSSYSTRLHLEVIPVPKGGYTSAFMSDQSNLGQALCYIRPVQKDVDMSNNTDDDIGDLECLTETCLACGSAIDVRYLRDHVERCAAREDGHSSSKKRREEAHQMPICQLACKVSCHEVEEQLMENNPLEKETVCPVCQKYFAIDTIETHASSCGESSSKDQVSSLSLEETLKFKREKLQENVQVTVVRKQLLSTAMEQLQDLEDGDWEKNITVQFIGEDAVDVGGPQRELFSLLFKSTFEDGHFWYNARYLQKKWYEVIGRAVGYALIIGHSGPRNLQRVIANYILREKVPSGNNIDVDDINDEYVKKSVKEISECKSDFSECAIEHSELLEKAGFSAVLSGNTKNEAIIAIKEYFVFYRILGPLRQLMEGMKFVGVLSVLQQYPDEAVTYFTSEKKLSAEDIKNFYKFTFSEKSAEKELEEMVAYNFNRFIQQVEKRKISWSYIDLYKNEDEVETKQITLEEVMQALTGCPGIPKCMECGLVIFDHQSSLLSSVNTCAPSITLRRLKDLQDYAIMQETFQNIVFGELGFGLQ